MLSKSFAQHESQIKASLGKKLELRPGKGLLDHLGIARAHLMGGCVGCSAVTVFAASLAGLGHVDGALLTRGWCAVRHRAARQARAASLFCLRTVPILTLVDLALSSDQGFTQDPRVGPWVSCVRSDPAFADGYRSFDQKRYKTLVAGLARTLFDRDTVPGPEPEDLLRLDLPALIVPGQDRVARDLGRSVPGGVPAARRVLAGTCR